MMASATHQAITHHTEIVNGIRIHYLTAGSGPALVLVHGFPQTSYAWRKVIPALAEHFTVIAPDLRGCGDSDRPDGSWDKRTAAADIHALAQHLGHDSIDLAGHDVGMMVAYAYAAAYPAQVRHLVLMEAALPGLGLEELYDAARYPRMYHLALFDAPNGFAEMLITGRERLFIEHFMRQQSYDPTGPIRTRSTSTRAGSPPPGPCAAGSSTSAAIRPTPGTTARTPERNCRCRSSPSAVPPASARTSKDRSSRWPARCRAS
jgi:pimeloyl-ACP methyl ester carboxylesterase